MELQPTDREPENGSKKGGEKEKKIKFCYETIEVLHNVIDVNVIEWKCESPAHEVTNLTAMAFGVIFSIFSV